MNPISTLADILVQRGLFAQKDIDKYLEESKKARQPLDEYLISEGLIEEKELAQAYAELF